MKPPFKRKLRNCISKNTYRYHFPDEKMEEVWSALVEKFGPVKELLGFSLLQLENEKLVIKRGKDESAFTLYTKKKFTKIDEDNLHNLIGLSNG